MLRQAFILNGNEIIYKRVYGNALSNSEMEDLSFKIISEVKRALGRTTGFFDFIKYRVSYDYDEGSKLTFIFITGLMDDFYRAIKTQLNNFKNFFLSRFSDEISNKNLKKLNFIGINVFLDEIHRNLKPKIAVVGFAGVGKTTIKQLIKMDEIPLQHVPTITGEIATIKIGKLFFRLFDFAGQEQFKFLWKGFIKESDAVLIVTDSTVKNIEKSKFFLDLKTKEVPHARAAIIGNKQDLPNALSISEIEEITGLKTYPMVANRKENRNKMIRIIADILDMSTVDSPLLSELFESTDLSYETLFGLGGEPIEEKSLIIPEESPSLEVPHVEEKVEINEIKDKIEQLFPEESEVESLIEISKRYNQGLKMPVEDALITSELFSEFEKNKSFGYYDKLSILFTALNCVFLTKTDPKKFPKFSAFFRNYKMHIFNSKEINQIRKYYSKVLKQVKA
ncbi:MAG: ADP-ribosylation factor-like protein [Candidatus Odinarchaeota archaeon]